MPVGGVVPVAAERAEPDDTDETLLLGLGRYTTGSWLTRVGLVGAAAALALMLVIAVVMALPPSQPEPPESSLGYAAAAPAKGSTPGKSATTPPDTIPPPHSVPEKKPAAKVEDKKPDEIKPAVVVISTLPPGGLTHTRYLCKRIRQRFPEIKIVVGRWNAQKEPDERSLRQLQNSGADEVTFNLLATLAILSGWRSVFAAGAAPPRKSPARKATTSRSIGTLPA